MDKKAWPAAHAIGLLPAAPLTTRFSRCQQVEKQFNTLLDACGAFRMDIGGAADVVSLGRAMEQLSSGTPLLHAP